MKIRGALVIVLLASGCRPSSEPVSEPEGADGDGDERTPAVGWLAMPGAKQAGSGHPRPSGAKPKPKAEPEPIDATACEYVCGDVFACVVDEGREPSAAASIELGCLDACVRVPGVFAACERPASIGADACSGYLGCVRTKWPSGDRSPTEIIDPSPSNGCDLACAAFARCYNASVDEAEECGRQCRAALTEDLQRVAGECSRLDGCEAIEKCVRQLPGA